MQRTLIIAIAVAVVAVGGWYLFSNGTNSLTGENVVGNKEDIIATVNGEELTRSRLTAVETQLAASRSADLSSLTDEERQQLAQNALNTLISRTLLQQEADASDITISMEDVDAQLETIRGQFENEAAFDAALSEQELTLDTLREQIENDLRAEAFIAQTLDIDSITVSDEEIQAAYDQVAAGNEDAPALSDVRDQVESIALQQKQQAAIAEFVEGLREKAEIEIQL